MAKSKSPEVELAKKLGDAWLSFSVAVATFGVVLGAGNKIPANLEHAAQQVSDTWAVLMEAVEEAFK